MWASPPSKMGYGFLVETDSAGNRMISHSGKNPGTETNWIFYPDSGRALFIGFNLDDLRSNPEIQDVSIFLDLQTGILRRSAGRKYFLRPKLHFSTEVGKFRCSEPFGPDWD